MAEEAEKETKKKEKKTTKKASAKKDKKKGETYETPDKAQNSAGFLGTHDNVKG